MIPTPEPLSRILLVRNDRIGDLVLTLPAIEAVRRCWPRAKVTLLASSYAGPLLANQSGIDQMLLDEPSEGAWKLSRRLRAAKFDAALVFNSNTRNCLATWLARIPRRVLWAGKPAGRLLATHRVTLRRSHPPIHEAEFALAFVRQLGVQAELAELQPRLAIDSQTSERVRQRIARELPTGGPLFGVHPGNKKSAYNWPAERYAELVGQLAARGRVMVTGGPDEGAMLGVIRGRLSSELAPRVGFFTDFTLLELSAAISQQMALAVSSTGPMHLAGIVGTPVVALFSPHPAHAPAKWSPLGERHTLLVAPMGAHEDPRVPPERGTEIMNRIRVPRVAEAMLAYATSATQHTDRSIIKPHAA